MHRRTWTKARMRCTNNWPSPKSTWTKVEAKGEFYTYEVYMNYSCVLLLADALERAVRTTLADGIRTGDLMGADGEARGFRRVGTDGFRDAVLERLGG